MRKNKKEVGGMVILPSMNKYMFGRGLLKL